MKKKKISQSFQSWLLILVIIAFLIIIAFLWIFQTKLSENSAIRLLELNISDVHADITDASDDNLLELTWQIAEDINEHDTITSEYLLDLTKKFDVTEISYINEKGIIVASTYKDFINFDMSSGNQAEEFLVLLSGTKEYVQSYQPLSYDTSISRKYAGVILERGGFVQVGYGAERFQKDIDKFVVGVTKNRHVGENGCIIIVDEEWNIVSDRYENEGKNLAVTGIEVANIDVGEVFTADVYGESCYCICEEAEGYGMIAVMPCSEAALSRNVSVGVTTGMQIIIFVALFIMIYFLVNRLVVENIYKINGSLSDITSGKLDTVVDVRSYVEFAALSDDINATVDTLKRYISEAEERIDAELALAKAIQHSVLPSVGSTYSERTEFDIWATMHTAKEVGGDFYDFYFVNDETLAIVVADVSGKGIPAAMFMMTAKAVLKNYAESGMSVEEVFTHANQKLCEGNEAGMFVTAWMGFVNIKTGVVQYANAGHNPPLIKKSNGSISYMKSRPSFVLAGMEDIFYRKNTFELEPGDILYLYTDGVTEATNSENELYGEEYLQAVINQCDHGDAKTICETVKGSVDSFVKDAPQFDDITMVCLIYRPEKALNKVDTKEMTVEATVDNITIITEFVNEQLEKISCPIKAKRQIDIAIDEIMANIVNYAYDTMGGNITVRVWQEEDNNVAAIAFVDSGIQYNPLERKNPDITLSAEEREPGGLGIYLVKKSMDEVEYEYSNGCNVFTIKKRLDMNN